MEDRKYIQMQKQRKKKFSLFVVMWRLIGWLYPKCHYCKGGRLIKIETFHYKPNMDIDIYIAVIAVAIGLV